MEQLETHLRTLGAPAIDTLQQHGKTESVGPAPASIAHPPTKLRIDQLESALDCVKKAATALAERDKLAVSSDERAGMQRTLAALEQRVYAFEREFATVSEQLLASRRETEEHRQRTFAAESKLDDLMAAVAKMIAPLGSAGGVTCRSTRPSLRGALVNDEVRV